MLLTLILLIAKSLDLKTVQLFALLEFLGQFWGPWTSYFPESLKKVESRPNIIKMVLNNLKSLNLCTWQMLFKALFNDLEVTISPAIIWQRLKNPLCTSIMSIQMTAKGWDKLVLWSVQSSKQCDMGNTMLHCLDMRTKKLCPPGSSLIAFFTRGTEPSGLRSGGG